MSTSQATNNDNSNKNNSNNKPPIAAENLAKTQFQVEGMSCQACATRIEKVLNKKPAIESASVSFAGETLNVSYDGSQANADQISEWVSKTGFTAVPMLDNQIPQAVD